MGTYENHLRWKWKPSKVLQNEYFWTRWPIQIMNLVKFPKSYLYYELYIEPPDELKSS